VEIGEPSPYKGKELKNEKGPKITQAERESAQQRRGHISFGDGLRGRMFTLSRKCAAPGSKVRKKGSPKKKPPTWRGERTCPAVSINEQVTKDFRKTRCLRTDREE